MKKMKNILIVLLAMMLATPVMAADDLEGEATAEPIDWEPVITSFYLKPRQANTTKGSLKLEQKSALPGYRAAWLEVKPLIAPRKDAYGENDTLVGGWKIEKEEGSEGIVALIDKTTPEKPVLTMLKDEAAELVAGIDVLMTDPTRKDQILKDHFKIIELSIAGPYDVSDDTAQFRAAMPADAKPRHIYMSIDKKSEPFGKAWNEFGLAGSTASLGDAIGRAKGVAEYRIRVTLSGKFSAQEQEQLKSAEGAIRVVYLSQGINVDKLNFDSEKGVSWTKTKSAKPAQPRNP